MPTSASQDEAVRSTPAADGSQSRPQGHEQDRELTITIRVDRVADAVTTSVAQAGHVLSARGGLPLYAGLGVLAAADVIAWPTAVAAGLGYAVLRRWGPWSAPARPPWEVKPAGTGAPRAGVPEVAAREAQIREAQAREESRDRETQIWEARARAAGTGQAGARAAGAGQGGTRGAGVRQPGTRAGGTRAGGTRAGGTRAGGTRAAGTRAAGTRTGRSGDRTPAAGTSRARRATGLTQSTDAADETGPQA